MHQLERIVLLGLGGMTPQGQFKSHIDAHIIAPFLRQIQKTPRCMLRLA